MKFIVGKKQEMTQMFREDGKAEPVTLVLAAPVEVSLIRTNEKDGYTALQVRRNNMRREVRLKSLHTKDATGIHELGATLTVSQFAAKPSQAKEDYKGDVYSYLTISKSNLKDTSVSGVIVNYKVERKWLASRSASASDVVLSRYDHNR